MSEQEARPVRTSILGRIWARPVGQTLIVAHAIFLGALGLWLAGFFEPAELTVYDSLVSVRAALYSKPDPVVIIGADERDLNELDWPLPDEALATVLERLEAEGAGMIGVDLLRDRPRGAGIDHLNSVLKAHDNIIGIFKFAAGRETPISGPPVLQGTDRLAFANSIPDPGGIVRRGLIFTDDGTNSYESHAFRLARGYLANEGIQPRNDPRNPDALLLGPGRLMPFTGNQGGYIRADDGGYQVMVDFLGGAHPFPVFSMTKLLGGAVPADAIKGKVVIVGVAAESVKDIFFTPLSKPTAVLLNAIYGAELHGHMAAELIRAGERGIDPVRGTPFWLNIVLFWLMSLLGGLSVTRIHSLAVAMGGSLGVAVVLAGIGFALLYAGAWIPVVCPSVSWIASALLESTLRWSQERRARSQLMHIFSQNVSPAIAESLWQHRDAFTSGGRPRPQQLVGTVLFTDIRGFTTVSEKMDPEALLGWLNVYMERMAEIVLSHDGVINKYIGDSIMAVFGVPIARTTEAEIGEDARKAVDCALAMRQALDELNAEWSAEKRPLIGMRVGINTGPLVAGTLGSQSRLEYTVLGDTVNTASRLESFDKSLAEDVSCRILVSAATCEYLDDRYAVERVGEVKLKGKEGAVPIYLVHSHEQHAVPYPKPSARSALAGAAALVLALAAFAAPVFADPMAKATSLYNPPKRGAPISTIEAASRGSAAQAAKIETLAPKDHAGQTHLEQPTLYWYASAPITQPVEITLTDDNDVAPLIDETLPAPQAAGFHAVSLAGTKAHLKAGPVYQWAVAIVVDPKMRSGDIVSGNYVQRVDATVSGSDAASLAQAGLWYDALDAASRQSPALRAELLKDVGITDTKP